MPCFPVHSSGRVIQPFTEKGSGTSYGLGKGSLPSSSAKDLGTENVDLDAGLEGRKELETDFEAGRTVESSRGSPWGIGAGLDASEVLRFRLCPFPSFPFRLCLCLYLRASFKSIP